jgi:RNA polymerase sigma factor (TIGR02999 family)
MQGTPPKDITHLLVAWSEGDPSALDRLAPLIHAELHRLAHNYMRREQPGHLLQTSALINEAYIRLIDWKNVRWQNRAHFFGVAAQLMRRVLVDFAREKQYLKRGGGALQVSRWMRHSPRWARSINVRCGWWKCVSLRGFP